MDVPIVIKRRLKELGLDQRDLAAATQVTESYISQLLARKKAPPAPGRTDIYERMSKFLRLPGGELSKLAELQRLEDRKKKVTEPLAPLFKDCRELILRKCEVARQVELRRIFDKEPLGALERLVTQKLLDVAKGVAREELENEEWLRRMAQLSGRSYEEMRVVILEFLDIDIFSMSVENWIFFLDPLIESWDIDLETFSMKIVLNQKLALGGLRRFEFVEKEPQPAVEVEPGFEEFLSDKSLSGDATGEEIECLKLLKFAGRRPTPMYYYRELQSLRDPLHFRPRRQPGEESSALRVSTS